MGLEELTLTDTHCHLDFESFDPDREEALERARETGLIRILNPGIDLASSRKAVELAEAHQEVFAAVGVHPNSALTFDRYALDELAELAAHPKVAAIGEIGLDYYRDRAPRHLQKIAFRRQLELAAEQGLPVVIHNRQATRDVLALLVEWRAQLLGAGSPLAESPGVLHSYSDTVEIAFEAIASNFYIGITGPVTFLNASEHQRVVAALPKSHLLIETDAPFLTPHPHRGQRNEPAYVRLVAEKIASLLKQPVSEIARTTTENAGRLFNW